MRYFVPLSIIAAAVSMTAASALEEQQSSAPTETSGVEARVLGATSLDAFLARATSGTLRTREIILQPGAKIAIHSHDERPGAVFVIEGEIVEYRSDSDDPIVRRQGDSFLEGPGLTHWSENASDKPARVFAVDIAPEEPEKL